jgi:RNA polymerase sigma-70 factor (ECF subfamily)
MAEPLQGNEYTDFIRRIRLGDERAAEELIHRYEPEIRLEVRTMLRLRDPRLRRIFDSMDICQSVMASFFVRAAVGDFELDEPSQLIRLLVGMARNRLAEKVRYHQRHRRDVRRTGMTDPEQQEVRAGDDTPSEVISRRELLDMFRERLSAEERELAELRGQGLDWAAIAGKLGGSAEARRKQLARAIARVGQELGLDPVAD